MEIGAILLKDSVVGRDNRGDNPGTLYRTLHERWTEPQECLIEVALGETRTITNTSSATCWDLIYKQWICVLRDFANLGGREPRKEARGSSNKARLDPNCQDRLVKFAWNLGLHTNIIQKRIGNDPRKEQLRAFVSDPQARTIHPRENSRCYIASSSPMKRLNQNQVSTSKGLLNS